MFGTFVQFASLDSLAKELKLPMLKGSTKHILFEIEWFSVSYTNARRMAAYNIMDCHLTLELRKKRDLIK